MASGFIKQLSRISLGVVLILVWAWIYLRAEQLFGVNAEAMKDIIQTYLIFTTTIFSLDALSSRKVEAPLFRISFLKAFPKFLLSAGISLIVLLIFQLTYSNNSAPIIFDAVSNLGLGVILLHAFFVATIEEKAFRGWLTTELIAFGQKKYTAWIISAIVFAFFHYLLNEQWLTILIYIPLGLVFQWGRDKWTPKTDMVNSGMHFAWNIWVLGFLTYVI